MAMIKEVGSKNFPVWLIGDSNPRNWSSDLATPLDPRHPAIHNIWTPIIDTIQDRIYRAIQLRIDTSRLYIRNAIENPNTKPKNTQVEWALDIRPKMDELKTIIQQHNPIFVFSFGAFAYEFIRRTLGEKPEHAHKYWGAKSLGNTFRKHADQFDVNQTNVFPLLHVTIARGKFIQSHNYFCNREGANYFEYVGKHLADIITKYKDNLKIWV